MRRFYICIHFCMACFNMKILFFIAFLVIPLCIDAQQIRVVSNTDSEPIPFASAYFMHNKFAAISNEDGVIEFDIPRNDTLIITHIGYKDLHIDTNSLNDGYCVSMQPKNYSLSEIVVKPITATQLVKKAKELIIINYPTSLSKYNLSVENLISMRDSIYCCLRSSVIGTSLSYMKDKPCEYRLVAADTYINNREKYSFHVPYHTDAYPAKLIEQMHISSLDFIKNISDYQYSYAEEQGRYEYIIHFCPKKISRKHYLKGELVINSSDMAIKTIEYTIATPNVMAYDEKVVTIGLGIKVYSEGKHYIKSCITKLAFEKIEGYYHLVHAVNNFEYRYIRSDGQTFDYVADNSVINHLGVVQDVDSYRQIALYGYDLTEWKHNRIKRTQRPQYLSRKINRAIQTLKEKYPDIDFSEMDTNN